MWSRRVRYAARSQIIPRTPPATARRLDTPTNSPCASPLFPSCVFVVPIFVVLLFRASRSFSFKKETKSDPHRRRLNSVHRFRNTVPRSSSLDPTFLSQLVSGLQFISQPAALRSCSPMAIVDRVAPFTSFARESNRHPHVLDVKEPKFGTSL